MKEFFLEFLLSFDELFNQIVTIIAIAGGIMAIVFELKKPKEDKKKKWIYKCIIVVSILVIISTVIRDKITKVPSVVGRTYQDACNILSRYELGYNLVLDNGVYVVEQNPDAGTIVEKNTKVELYTEPIGNNPEVRAEWEKNLNVDFGNIAISFMDKDIILTDEGKTKACYGTIVDEYKVKYAYLLEEVSGVEYHDYIIEDGVMIFEHIPQGIEFELYVMLEGYELENTKVTISSQNMVEGTYSFKLSIIKTDMEMLLPTTFYVANSEDSTIMNVNYMSDIKLWVQWLDEPMWSGDYYTTEDGNFEYSILINKDRKIKVLILNPFGNGMDYECEVTLYAPKIGEVNPKDIIFLNSDGSCNVVNSVDYFGY